MIHFESVEEFEEYRRLSEEIPDMEFCRSQHVIHQQIEDLSQEEYKAVYESLYNCGNRYEE